MFMDTPLARVLFPVICAWVLGLLVIRRRADGKWPFAAISDTDPIKRAWLELKWSTISAGSLLLFLLLALPGTAFLSTFEYPADLGAVSQPQRLLFLLQDYNRALVRTTEALYWVLFIIVWWFLTAVYSLSRER